MLSEEEIKLRIQAMLAQAEHIREKQLGWEIYREARTVVAALRCCVEEPGDAVDQAIASAVESALKSYNIGLNRN